MRSAVGGNLDGRIPKPLHGESPPKLRLKFGLYEFLGKLMGLSIRSRSFLDLHLTSVVWKPLVCDKVAPEDVEAVSKGSFSEIEELAALDAKTNANDSKSVAAFDAAAKKTRFKVMGSDAKEVHLVAGGNLKRVTYENHGEYIELALKFKLSEFSRQAQAIRRGLATVVPYQYLSMFTWTELRDQVCGRVNIDLKLLKSMTTYHGYIMDKKKNKEVKVGPNSPHIRLFWKMMEERFNERQRSELIFFVWGRNRLPLNKAGFAKDRFQIMLPSLRAGTDPNKRLPVSHTCFFQLELPPYTDFEVMLKKFMYAMANCKYIDGDNTSHARNIARRR